MPSLSQQTVDELAEWHGYDQLGNYTPFARAIEAAVREAIVHAAAEQTQLPSARAIESALPGAVTTADTPQPATEGIPRANVLAMYNRAKQLALDMAWLGKAGDLRFAQGGLNFLDALLRDVGATHAAARDASNGGYVPAAGFEAAWAALPKRAEDFSLAQMQQFLGAHGIELAPDAVTNSNLDGVVDLKDRELTTLNAHDEQPAPGIDVRNRANPHSAPLVQTPIVKE